MGDVIFEDLLVSEAELRRPVVKLAEDGVPETPVYEPEGSVLQVRITPAASGSEDDLLGRVENATEVCYVLPGDVRVADRLVVHAGQTALAEDTEAGTTVLVVGDTSELRDGQQVEIGGAEVEEVTIVSVAADSITVSPALSAEHAAGDRVTVLERHEVLAVEDAAGAGHHLRLALRAVR